MQILVNLPVELRHRALLERTAPDAKFHYVEAGRETRADVQNADVILGNVAPALLAPGDKLRWMQTGSAGVEPYLTGCMPKGAVLTNATGAYGLAISEYMVAVWLELIKKLHLYRDAQKTGAWKSRGTVTSAYGAKVLVLGLGDIGGEFAKRAKALGATVIGMRRAGTDKPDFVDTLIHTDELDDVLPTADVVAVTLPGTPETRNLLSAARINAMKDGAVLINVGRGYIVDTEALTAALKRGRLGGAALDVTEPEPLPADHPLWTLPNAVITPHISGGYHLHETYERIMRIVVQNLEAFLNGTPMRNVVDFETGYRKL